jgi:hypothetical protein
MQLLTGLRTLGVWQGSQDTATTTIDLDFPPAFSQVTVTLSRFNVGGDFDVARAGILNFRFRNPDHSESTVAFPAGPNDPINALPAAVGHDQMTHVTMQLLTFNCFTRALCNVFQSS